MRTVRSLGIEAPHRPYVFSYEEGDLPPGHLRIDTLFTGISAGTELTFLKDTNPYLRARYDGETGLFLPGEPGARYPVPFLGYMEVGRVTEAAAPGWAAGDVVAGTWGHKTGHTADVFHEMLVPLPAGMDPMLGIFVGQMGPIAANGILHADAERLRAAPERLGAGIAGRPVIVLGGGTVGLFTALFARAAGAEVILSDPSPFRRARAGALGLTALPEGDVLGHAKARWRHGPGDRGADVVFQTRAHGAALHLALQALRPQGTVVDLAFYQEGATALRLGEEFHHNGLSLVCAQIGRVPRGLAPLWDRRRLAAETVALLARDGEAIRREMVTHEVPFDEAPDFLAMLIRDRPEFLQIVIGMA